MMIQEKHVESSAVKSRVESQARGRADASERIEGTPRGEARIDEQGNEGVRPDRETVLRLVEKTERELTEQGVALKFNVSDDAGAIQVEVRDAHSDKVIRKIPADEVVQLSKSIKDMAGKLLDRPI